MGEDRKSMKAELHEVGLRILSDHRIMAVATNRPDGWPQTTTVAYVNRGFDLYCFISPASQKMANIRRDNRVSVSIAGDFATPNDIQGISLGGRAHIIADLEKYQSVTGTFLARFPEFAAWPHPSPTLSVMVHIRPEILSILNYSRRFGHSDLVVLKEGELSPKLRRQRIHWLGD